MRNALNLKKDEAIINTFEGKLELKKDNKTISVNLVLTNQNFIFLEEGKGALLTVPFENIAKVTRGFSRHKSIIILAKHINSVQFYPSNMNDVSMNKFCALIPKLISARKKTVMNDACSG